MCNLTNDNKVANGLEITLKKIFVKYDFFIKDKTKKTITMYKNLLLKLVCALSIYLSAI